MTTRIGFTAPEAAKLSTVPVRTIQHWRTIEFFNPVITSRTESGGYGRKEITVDLSDEDWTPKKPNLRSLFYSFAQVCALKAVKDLVDGKSLTHQALAGADMTLHGRYPEECPFEYEKLIAFDEAWQKRALPWDKWAQKKDEYREVEGVEEFFLDRIIPDDAEQTHGGAYLVARSGAETEAILKDITPCLDREPIVYPFGDVVREARERAQEMALMRDYRIEGLIK